MDYQLVDEAIRPPFTCICGQQEGPFVDTRIERPGRVGRLYLCHRCVDVAASLMGYASPRRVLQWEELLEGHKLRKASLERELEDERATKSINLQDLRELVHAGHENDTDTAAPGRRSRRKQRAA